MRNNEDIFDDMEKDEEELLDFEFEELPDEDIEDASGISLAQEEPIELVNIVETGEVPRDLESDGMDQLLDEEALGNHVEAGQGSDLGLNELTHSQEEEASLSLESDFDSTLEGAESSEMVDTDFELLEDDLETIADAELFGETTVDSEGLAEPEPPQQLEPVEQAGLEETIPDILPELPREDLDEALPSSAEQVADEIAVASTPHVEEPVEVSEVSEERIETIITKVVQDVVERVVRETVANVAEKVIREAIEALKESIESANN
jgi:hypothetical protein